MDRTQPDDPGRPTDDDATTRFERTQVERTRPAAGGAITPRLGLSVPGAIGGVLLIGAIAFGASFGAARSTTTDDGDAPSAAALVDTEPSSDAEDEDASATATPKPTKAPGAVPTEKASPEATEKPAAEPEPTKKPEPKPTEKAAPKPTEKPEPKPTEKPVLSLSLAVKEGAILIDFSACEVDGAEYYKIVRSTDSTVRWPAGDGDSVVAAIEVGAATKARDEHAKPGKKAWYRVFCVRHTDDGYRVLAASATKAIVAPAAEATPKPTPHPEPSAMWIEAGVDGATIVVSWEACGSEGFSHYRILRKVDGDATVIAEVGDASTTTYVDSDVEPGVTYRYLVQAKGHIGDDWFLLGTTEWTTVTAG